MHRQQLLVCPLSTGSEAAALQPHRSDKSTLFSEGMEALNCRVMYSILGLYCIVWIPRKMLRRSRQRRMYSESQLEDDPGNCRNTTPNSRFVVGMSIAAVEVAAWLHGCTAAARNAAPKKTLPSRERFPMRIRSPEHVSAVGEGITGDGTAMAGYRSRAVR